MEYGDALIYGIVGILWCRECVGQVRPQVVNDLEVAVIQHVVAHSEVVLY